jgi:hypothetical protein
MTRAAALGVAAARDVKQTIYEKDFGISKPLR